MLEEARRLAGVEHGDPDRDRNFLYGFAYAWLLGKTPTVMHYDDVWRDQRRLEDASSNLREPPGCARSFRGTESDRSRLSRADR